MKRLSSMNLHIHYTIFNRKRWIISFREIRLGRYSLYWILDKHYWEDNR